MVKTLITDGFEHEVPEAVNTDTVSTYAPHNIVYGLSGWTDNLDDATIALLVAVDAIILDRTITGVGFETRIYVSVAGTAPKEADDA